MLVEFRIERRDDVEYVAGVDLARHGERNVESSSIVPVTLDDREVSHRQSIDEFSSRLTRHAERGREFAEGQGAVAQPPKQDGVTAAIVRISEIVESLGHLKHPTPSGEGQQVAKEFWRALTLCHGIIVVVMQHGCGIGQIMQHYCLFSKGAKMNGTASNDVVMPTRTRRRRCLTVFAVLSLIAMPFASLGLASPASASGAKSSASGCGVGSPKTAILSLKIDGINRTVIVHVPTTYTNESKLPLVLNLHGSGSTAAAQDVFSDMDQTADEDNFIVAFPQALIPDRTGYDWNVPGEPLVGGRAVPVGSPNDVKFLTNLVGALEHMYCVNPMAVYATGFSGGAREVSQLACDDSKIFAAVAPVSGLRHPKPCPATRAVPVIAFHGSDDLVDPFAGKGEAYWTYSVRTAAKDWAKQDHCSKSPTVSKSSGVIFSSYSKCAKGAAVDLYEVIGEGHEWPGGPTMPSSITDLLGPQSDAINANSLMWSFFASHQL